MSETHDYQQPIISYREVQRRLGDIGRTTLWHLEKSGDFPKAIQISKGRKGFIAAEIDAWIKQQAAKRDGVAA